MKYRRVFRAIWCALPAVQAQHSPDFTAHPAAAGAPRQQRAVILGEGRAAGTPSTADSNEDSSAEESGPQAEAPSLLLP